MELTLQLTMRGEDKKQSSMLMLMSPESRVPQTHPLRAIKKLADEALAELSLTFDAMYAEGGRPSIPPERLLKSMLLMALYTVRSERQFCEQLDYNLLFRWFLLASHCAEQGKFHPADVDPHHALFARLLAFSRAAQQALHPQSGTSRSRTAAVTSPRREVHPIRTSL